MRLGEVPVPHMVPARGGKFNFFFRFRILGTVLV